MARLGLHANNWQSWRTCALSDYDPAKQVISFEQASSTIIKDDVYYKLPQAEDRFWELHNYLNQEYALSTYADFGAARHSCGIAIDTSAVLGAWGMKLYRDIDDHPIQVIHIGTLSIGDNVHVGANATIHIGVFGVTVVGNYCHIGANCNIGHGCRIGDGSMLTASVCLAGSVVIGKGCWLGIGTMVVDHVSICDRVKTGAGTVVIRDIKTPGVYVGNPARRISDWDEKL